MDSGIDKAKEQIKKLEDVISNDNQIISEIANLVAFFQDLSKFMSLSLIKTKKKMPITTRIPEILLWIDDLTILPQTHNLIDVVNQYLLILNSWSYEMDDHEFLRTLQNTHRGFEKFLTLYYSIHLGKFVFDKISPINIIKKENEFDNDKTRFRRQQKYSSIFHFTDINSIRFTPEIESVNALASYFENYKDLSAKDALIQIKNDLIRSYKELSYLLSDEMICNVSDRDFLMNPSIDIIRENPQFQQYSSKMSSMLPLIQTQFFELNETISSLLSKIKILNKSLNNSFTLPQINFDELHQITTEETKYYIEKQKRLFMKKVFKEFMSVCPEFHIQTAKLINKIYKVFSSLCQTEDIDSIESQLMELRKYIQNSNYQNIFMEQDKKQASIRKTMQDELRKINASIPSKASNSDIFNIIEEHKKKVEELQNVYISERNAINDEMTQAIVSHRVLFSKIQHKPLFPYEIEKMLHTLSHQAANLQWGMQRYEMQKEEKKKHKEQINNLNNNLTKLKAEIQEKKKLVQSLKANSNPQKIPKKSASCLCSSCHAKQVECVIVGCGHTFCEACLLNLKSCPKCNHIITENDVCKVNWF